MKSIPLALAVTLLAGLAPTQTKRGVFLLDRSGSMIVNGGSGTRVAKSLIAVDADLQSFFSNPQVPTEALIVEFASGSGYYTVLGGGWQTNGPAARAVAATSTTLRGSTQLADAICASIQDLRTRVLAGGAQFFCEQYLYVYSDGGENSSTGICSGGDDVNAGNGRCPQDTLTLGVPAYAGTSSGGSSWQLNTCAQIDNLSTFPAATCLFSSGLVFGRLFNSVTDIPTESQVFRLLRSIAAQTGGRIIHVADNEPFDPGLSTGITIIPAGCRAPNGELPTVEATDVARVGSAIALQLRGTTLPLPMMFLGFAQRQPALPLGFLGAPTCFFGVDQVVFHIGTFLPITIPQNPALVNLELFAQGGAAGVSFNPVALSHVLRLSVLP